MRSLWHRMMALDPRARPSFAEIAQVLEAVAAERGVAHAQIAAALRADMGAALDALRARLRGVATAEVALPERIPTEVEASVAAALDDWAANDDATVPDGARTREDLTR
ncbi:MAG: hypothetical protein M5U28_15080 [Sandaracinaceae bacterium]|nr:hypothetical protein [Sandaracinaceae bacterium]